MRRRRVMANPEAARPVPSRNAIMEMGVVHSHPLGSNRADVRLGEGDNRVMRKVCVPTGLRLNVGDRVAIIKPAGEDTWLVMNPYSPTRESGLDQGDVGRHCETIWNLVVGSVQGGLIASWDTWTDYPVCFHLMYNTSASEAGATEVRTWGNQWVIPAVVEMFFKVRVIYVSERTTGTYHGPWTSWISGIPLP